MASPIQPEDLVIHVLNVGFGDNILIEIPVDSTGQRSYGLVDCRSFDKTRRYLNKLVKIRPGRSQLAFACATHPHYDHISGIRRFLVSRKYRPRQFWDSGFRHNSQTYQGILETLWDEGIDTIRVSSGMEWYFGKVQVTVLAPSVVLRNKYATYGVDMNNASIVLRLEHHEEDVVFKKSQEYEGKNSAEAVSKAGKSVVILAGDAEFDSWAQVVHEFPTLERNGENNPRVKKMVSYLACAVIKVAHHGSMHSTSLDVYEKMRPKLAIVSTKQEVSAKNVNGRKLTRELFPHRSATIALEECGAQIVTTDGSYESQNTKDGQEKCSPRSHPGSVIVVVPPGRSPRWIKLDDESSDVPEPPTEV